MMDARVKSAHGTKVVIAGLDPAIHLLQRFFQRMMDARVKPAHDGGRGNKK
jgi:hypothetical protein